MIPTMIVSGFRRVVYTHLTPKHLIMGQAKVCHIEHTDVQGVDMFSVPADNQGWQRRGRGKGGCKRLYRCLAFLNISIAAIESPAQ